MYQTLLDNLNNQTLIITVNQRLCAHLLQEYAKLQPSAVFTTPAITAVNPWLKAQWESCQQEQRLLEPQQVHWLWQQVIEKSEHTDFILPTAQISQLVHEAYSQMHGWQVPWELLAESSDKDHQTFLNWAREFDELLNQHQAITTAHLPNELAKRLNADSLPKEIYLVGFQDIPPALNALFRDAIRIETDSQSESVLRTESSNNLAELTAMAHWAKNLLDSTLRPADTQTLRPAACPRDPVNPSELLDPADKPRGTEDETSPTSKPQDIEDIKTIRIGCVVPELQSLRKPTLEVFRRAFAKTDSPMTPSAIYPFNISAGLTLIDYPMLQDAYNTLMLHSENAIDTDNLCNLLGSPYLFPLNDGMNEAAEFSLKIREPQLTTLPTAFLQTQLKQQAALKRLTDFIAMTLAPLQFPSEWAQYFIQQLETIGWPGTQSLSSEEYQLLSQWNSQLQALSRLDDFAGPISFHTCLSHLHHLLKSTSFQPQTDHSNAPIQVLGLLEAAGLPYDHLWIMGLDDSAWPPAAQSNPFIPQYLQQQFKLPHNSGEHELAYATELQATLIANAKQTILSSPAQDNSSNKQASALIKHFPFEVLPTHNDEPYKAIAMENFSADYAPALKPQQKLRGGTAIASNQAACAFRAFALHRLGANSPRDLFFGVSPLLHGSLLHETLERIWRQLKSQQALLALTQEQQRELVSTQTLHVMRSKSSIPARFYELEKERLIEQINDWLNYERERPPFTVAAIEKSESLSFSGHTMSVRMDRMDQIDNQSYVILDYKTSRLTNPVKWLCSPPLDSQLPFYACFSQDNAHIVGCSYAVINRDETELKGYAHNDYADAIPLASIEAASKYTHLTSWEESIESWKTQLSQLMDGFIAGYAAVAPNPVARPCDHCELSALCRIEECEA